MLKDKTEVLNKEDSRYYNLSMANLFNKKNAITALIIVGFLVAQALFYGWFSPPKPAVVVYLAENTTQILGFTYAKYPGTLQCVACDDFYAEGTVTYNNTIVCDTKNSFIGLGEAYMPLLCSKELEQYQGLTVEVHIKGGIRGILKEDTKSLVLEFREKDDFRH